MSKKSKTFNILALIVIMSMIATTVSAQANMAPSPVDSVEALPAFQGQPDEPETVEAGIQRLIDNVGDAQISVARSTGMVRFVRLTARQSQRLVAQLGAKVTFKAQAAAFFAEYGSIFGIRDANAELTLVETKTDELGATHLSYVQDYQGVPVFAGTMRVHFDANGLMTAGNGAFVPDIAINATPTLSADEANAIAEATVNGPAYSAMLGEVSVNTTPRASAVSTILYVYRDGLIQGTDGLNYLVYEVEVSNGAGVREFVYVNAHKGDIVNQITGIQDLDRRVYTETFDSLVWTEGDPYPWTGGATTTETIGVNNLITVTGQTYNVFSYTFGFDSYGGNGETMHAVYNDTMDMQCPNAHWTGDHIGFCTGYDVDDVIAHEWSHAYTEGTHELIYQYQPGALNESYSDIWGEVVDQINGYHTDTPNNPRTDATCSNFTPPGGELLVLPPSPAADSYTVQVAGFGPALTVTGTTGLVVMADDGDDSDGGTTTDGCQALTNGTAISGNVALIDRGSCQFTLKVLNAQAVGAIGVIIANHQPTGLPGMGAGDNAELVTIPSVGIARDDGDTIKANLPLTATMRSTEGIGDDSVRWLMGEDVNGGFAAGGGAMRDMWYPSCYGDPPKVTDPVFYACGPNDGGGVHTNSGVPNHAFALLVDGGTYNGQAITGIGMVKAAHLYWRAQSVYQVAVSDFADHADALETSCADLVTAGTDLLGFDGVASGQVMTTTDCTQVANAMLAVEMRTPAICEITPMFDANPPAPCETTTTPFFSETFDADPGAAWVLSSTDTVTNPYDNWEWVATMPLTIPETITRTGGLFAADTPAFCGGCDRTGAMYVDSPTMTVPTGDAGDRALLVFEHYVATEGPFDGGNVWISVNGGAWQALATDDFVFNPYNTAGFAGTNPLGAVPGFSGVNDGELAGTWGESQADVSAYASAGDVVQLRFASGTDLGDGVNGWYLDDVSVYYCQAPTPVIGVDPSSVSSTQGTCDQETETLTISNSGQAQLDWNVFDAVVWNQPWTIGSGDASSYFSNFGAGAYQGDDFTLPTTMTIEYINAQGFVNTGSLAAAEQLDWYIFQDTISGTTHMPDGYPGSGTETWHFSATVGTLGVDITGGFGDIDVDLVAAGLPALELGPGTYWLVVYPTFTYAAGVQEFWYWLQTEVSGSPSMIFNDGLFTPPPPDGVWDANDNDKGFFIGGYTDATADCTAPSDVVWLDVDPTVGNIPYGGMDDSVDVTFDSTGLMVGDYMATLCIESNDTAMPLVEVPLTMTVELAPDWTKMVWVNGNPVTELDDLIVVEAGDTIMVKDTVDICYVENITFTLTEEWSESLGLVSYETVILPGGSAVWPGMTVTVPYTDALAWSVTDLPVDWTYAITKTFTVDAGTLHLGDRDYLTETLALEGAATEQIVLEFGPEVWVIYLPLVIK